VFSFKNTEEEFTAKAQRSLRDAEERRRRVIGYKLEVIGEEEEEEVNIEHPTLNIEVEEEEVSGQ
jgi:phage-related protein